MSDIDEKVTLIVTVEGTLAQVERSEKPEFMLDGEYDMNTLFGTCSMMAQFAKTLATATQTPDMLIDSMANLEKTLL